MKIGSLCTGYGGLDMAVEAYFNAKTIWCAEIDKHASQLIKDRFNITNHGDIKSIDWSSVEPVDILTAGYPCQPFSHAGDRKGLDDARHIFPYILEGISILRPRWVVLENVRGHLSLGLKEVLAGLTSIGYDARWEIVRASDVGAPHQRARLFIVAYPNSLGGGVSSSDTLTANTLDNRCSCRNTGGSKATVTIIESNGSVTNSDCDSCKKSRRADSCVYGKASEIINRSDRKEYRFSLEMDRQRVPNTLDQGKLNPVFVEYMMGLPTGWVTSVGLNRTQQLKMLGNGVVPQQAYQALKELCDTDHSHIVRR